VGEANGMASLHTPHSTLYSYLFLLSPPASPAAPPRGGRGRIAQQGGRTHRLGRPE